MGIKMSQAFPSKYVKAADLGGKEIKLTIARVAMEEVGQGQNVETKPVVYFNGTDKGLVLNVTNGNNISHMYGDDSDGWIGKQVTLFPAWVDFAGKTVEAIRVKPPTPTPAAAFQKHQSALANGGQAPLHGEPPVPLAGPDDPLDGDEIPF